MPTLAIPLKEILTDAAGPVDPVALPEAEAIACIKGIDGFGLSEPLPTRLTQLQKS